MVRLNIRLRITLAFTLLILVFSAVSGYVAFTLIRQTAEKGAANKAQSDLALGATLIDTLHPGDWEVRDGALYKGETRMNDNYALVDLIAERTGGTATIFQGDTRVATTVKAADTGQRATGTKAAENVVQRVLKEGGDYLGEALVAGNKFQTAYTPLRDASGEIVGMWYVGVSKAFLDELLRTAGLQLFLATSLMLLLSAVAAWVFARSFSQPLAALSAVVADVEAGELNRRFALQRGDEIGQLGQRFNQMVGTVSGVIRGIADASRQVAQAAQDLKQSSDSFTEANSSIANAIQTVAAGSDSQVKLTDEAVQAVQAVVQQINEVARDSAEVSRVAQAAAATAASGVTAIERAVSQMSSVGETMEGFSGTIRALGERSQQIGQIVDLITGIADQTNLLALNAAIEAARAGEQGRGFAVVAEEVRKLAEQSAEAAKKIAGLVQEIQGDTARAVELMDVETGQVDEGINVVNEAGAAFRGLVESIETLSERIGRVTAATAAMNQNGGQVASAMDGIAEAARRAAGQASEVAAGSEEQFATLEQLASLAGSLMELAEKLSASVQAFKI